jgi:hypothetical protein
MEQVEQVQHGLVGRTSQGVLLQVSCRSIDRLGKFSDFKVQIIRIKVQKNQSSDDQIEARLRKFYGGIR